VAQLFPLKNAASHTLKYPYLLRATYLELNSKFGDDCAVESEDDLNASTFETYVYLVKTGKPVGPRDVMRGANLISPS
jgi:hypothetical protein